MDYKKKLTKRISDVEGVDERLGKLMARRHAFTFSTLATSIFIFVIAVACAVGAFSDDLLKEEFKWFLLALGAVFFIIGAIITSTILDSICVYEYGIVKFNAFGKEVIRIAYDDIEIFEYKVRTIITKRSIQKSPQWVIGDNDKVKITIVPGDYVKIMETISEVYEQTGPWKITSNNKQDIL